MPGHELNELAALEGDLRRLLEAGGRAAAGDEGLARRGEALAALGRQVPALARIADAVKGVARGSPRRSAGALLDLLVLVRQARAGLAAPDAPREPLAEPEPAGPWATRTALRELTTLVAYLHQGYFDEPARQALAEPGVADLRLVGLTLENLRGGSDARADFVAEHVLPMLGPAMLGELVRGLEEVKPLEAARRLLAICRIDPAAGLDALRRLEPALAAWVVGRMAPAGDSPEAATPRPGTTVGERG